MVRAIKQFEPSSHVHQAYAGGIVFYFNGCVVKLVSYLKTQQPVFDGQGNENLRAFNHPCTMFKRIFNKRNQQHRFDRIVIVYVFFCKRKFEFASETLLLQVDIALELFNLTVQ